MNGYCLDTDIISATIKAAPPMHLVRRLAATPPSEQFTTSITVGELIYGAERTGRDALKARVESAIRRASTVLPFDSSAARVYGRVRAELERGGTPLADADLRIAAIALTHGLIVVTRNVKHFGRVPDLVVENWIDDPA